MTSQSSGSKCPSACNYCRVKKAKCESCNPLLSRSQIADPEKVVERNHAITAWYVVLMLSYHYYEQRLSILFKHSLTKKSAGIRFRPRGSVKTQMAVCWDNFPTFSHIPIPIKQPGLRKARNEIQLYSPRGRKPPQDPYGPWGTPERVSKHHSHQPPKTMLSLQVQAFHAHNIMNSRSVSNLSLLICVPKK